MYPACSASESRPSHTSVKLSRAYRTRCTVSATSSRVSTPSSPGSPPLSGPLSGPLLLSLLPPLPLLPLPLGAPLPLPPPMLPRLPPTPLRSPARALPTLPSPSAMRKRLSRARRGARRLHTSAARVAARCSPSSTSDSVRDSRAWRAYSPPTPSMRLKYRSSGLRACAPVAFASRADASRADAPVRSHSAGADAAAGSQTAASSSSRSLSGDHWHAAA